MAKRNSFVKDLISAIQDENTSLAEDAVSSAEYTGFLDTGSYILNAQLSGSIYGGMPNTKILALAGEQAVGKTFFALSICKNFLDKDLNAIVVWYLAEPAVTKRMLVERGIDPTRFLLAEPVTVFEWRHHVLKTLDAYMQTDEDERPPMLMVLDSLGALSTEHEIELSMKGENKRDMSKAPDIKGSFRQIDKKLAKAKVPMIVTNHIYSVIGSYFPTKELAGGSGLKYAGDQIIIFSKSKDREEKTGPVTGAIITSMMFKNRIVKENTKVQIQLSYVNGINRYYGLLDIADKYGIITKDGNKWKLPDGKKVFEKELNANPETYYTADVLQLIETAVHQEFEYGKSQPE